MKTTETSDNNLIFEFDKQTCQYHIFSCIQLHQNRARVEPCKICPLILTMFGSTTLFTVIDDINGDLNCLYGLKMLSPSSGTGTRQL